MITKKHLSLHFKINDFNMKKVIGIGNALTDILVSIGNDAFLEKFSMPRGSMQLVDVELSTRILQATEGMERALVSGGSAANSIHGLASLGIETGFVGKVGKDKWGNFFESDMKNRGIKTNLFKSESESGRAVALISPDSERTFATFLGAAIELDAKEITPDIFDGYDYLHIEGYLVQNQNLIETALKTAKEKGLIVSLDMASFNVVEQNRHFLLDMADKYVDILFANEEEAKAFANVKNDEKALEIMNCYCELAILKRGSKGSIIGFNGTKTVIDINPVKSIDTTGAGDLYAAGFLYGHANSLPLQKCGLIGSLTSEYVIQVIGPKIPDEKWIEVKQKIKVIAG